MKMIFLSDAANRGAGLASFHSPILRLNMGNFDDIEEMAGVQDIVLWEAFSRLFL